MGNRKFLIIVISVLSAVALFCLGASAREVDLEAVRDGGPLRISPANFQYPNSLIKSFVVLETADGVNSTKGTTLVTAFPSTSPLSVTYYSVQFQDLTGHWTSAYNGSSDEPVNIYFVNDGGWVRIFVDGSRIDNGQTYNSTRCRAVFYNEKVPIEGEYSGFVYHTVYGKVDPTFLFRAILDIGNKLLTFVTSNAIVLIPLVCFFGVFGISVIRRIVKGV